MIWRMQTRAYVDVGAGVGAGVGEGVGDGVGEGVGSGVGLNANTNGPQTQILQGAVRFIREGP